MQKGKLFLIPSYLDPTNGPEIMAPIVKEVIRETTYYLVEDMRTARRYISSLRLSIDIGTLHFSLLDKRSSSSDLASLMDPIFEGNDIGVLSEAGLPGIADPGRLAVDYAHRHDISAIPLPGPSSIIQALIASGMDGQRFSFHGYLPIEKEKRTRSILRLYQEVQRSGTTQVFMETPYRNNQLVGVLLDVLPKDALLCIASNITGEDESIHTKPVQAWKLDAPDLHKKPSVFCLGLRP